MVYRQLAERNLLPEAWGGETITVNCSAATREGLQELLEMVMLQAEILELKANPEERARGSVLESELHRGYGSTATLLIQNGTLNLGDALVFEHTYGRVKSMHDEHNKSINQASPSTPVRVTGLSGLPDAGCEFIVVSNEKEARKLCEEREAGVKREQLLQSRKKNLESLMERKAELSEKKVLNLILKADVQGSLEAIKTSLQKIPSDKVEINLVADDVGQISESDIQLAHASGAVIIGFHTGVESHAEELLKQTKVTVETYDVIYHLIDGVKKIMVSLLDKIKEEKESGSAYVKATFKSSQLGIIAGCEVKEGVIRRSQYVKVFRGDEQIWEGNIASLKRVQEDVKDVSKGLECGILLNNFSDLAEGDIIKSYDTIYHEQEL
jgi:translation initiation factor IF-2